MHAVLSQITNDALTLPESARAHLAQILLKSLDTNVEENIEQAWDAEIAIRLRRLREGTARGRSAEEVFRDIRIQYQP